MDFNNLFVQGQEISAFVKNSNRIWEGIIVNKSDGTKIVLNETTQKWKRLSDLESIKRVGRLLYEEEKKEVEPQNSQEFVTQQLDAAFSKQDDKKKQDTVHKLFAEEPKKDNIVKSLDELHKQANIKQKTITKPEQMKDEVDKYLQRMAGTSAAEKSAGDQAKTQAYQDEINKMINEDLKQLHPSLQPHLFEMSREVFHHAREFFNEHHNKKKTVKMLMIYGMSEESAKKKVDEWEKISIELGYVPGSGLHESVDEDDLVDFCRDKLEAGNFGRKEFELIKDYAQDNDAAGTQDKPKKADKKESLDYEDEEYLDIPDEVKKDVVTKVKKLISDNCEDIEDEIKSNFELTDDDAEQFIQLGMEEWLEENDVEVKDSIANYEDDVEQDFEDTIDKYDGPEEGLLDHLVDEYEIDGEEAEKIYDEKAGDLTECVLEFVKIVRDRLNEGF